jgi:hypothetical protein
LGATAAAGLAAAGLIDPTRLFAGTIDSLPLLSIGFAGGIPESGKGAVLGPASAMLTSDPGFLRRGAEVRVAGSGQAARSDIQEGGIQIDALFPARSGKPSEDRRFVAWNMDKKDGVRSESSNVRFGMPVAVSGSIRFLVHRTSAAKPVDSSRPNPPDATLQNTVELSLNSGSGAKLQRGVYVLALREASGDSAPNWSRAAVQNHNGRFTVEGLTSSYVVLVVDYMADAVAPSPRPRSRTAH